MTSDRKDDEMRQDAEWAWVAETYRDVPRGGADATARAVDAAVGAVTAGHRVQGSWRWVAGIAAAIGLIALGRGMLRPTTETEPVAGTGVEAGPPASATIEPPSVPAEPRRMVAEPPMPASASAPAPLASEPVPSPMRGDSALAVVPVRRDTVPAPMPVPAPAVAEAPQKVPAPSGLAGISETDRARLHTALGDEGLRDLAAMVARAAKDQLPAAPLLDRAMAGVAHGATPVVILATVERRTAALRQSRDALGPRATANELTAGADALEAGAIVSQLVQVRRLFPPSRATAGLLALAGLVADGVPARDAVAGLEQSVDAGATDATLLALRTGVTADVARGVAPLAALRARVQELGGNGDAVSKPDPRSPRPLPIDPPRTP